MFNTKKVIGNILGDKKSKNYFKQGEEKCSFCGRNATIEGKYSGHLGDRNTFWRLFCNTCYKKYHGYDGTKLDIR